MVVEAENLSLSPQVFRFGRKFARVSKIINKKVKANDYFVQMATFKPTPIVSRIIITHQIIIDDFADFFTFLICFFICSIILFFFVNFLAFLRQPFVLFFEDNPRALFSTFPTAAAIFNPLQHLVWIMSYTRIYLAVAFLYLATVQLPFTAANNQVSSNFFKF